MISVPLSCNSWELIGEDTNGYLLWCSQCGAIQKDDMGINPRDPKEPYKFPRNSGNCPKSKEHI